MRAEPGAASGAVAERPRAARFPIPAGAASPVPRTPTSRAPPRYVGCVDQVFDWYTRPSSVAAATGRGCSMYDDDLAATARALAQDLQLVRPLAVFDLETTGLNVDDARTVEIAVLRIEPPGAFASHSRRVNPGRPIPAEATAVHGITDEDVAHEPSFRDIAPRLARFLDGCDLAGFNIGGFDIPVLEAEFRRAGLVFSMEGRRIVDAQGIFHHYERRDLAAAVRFYTGRDIEDAHSAQGDLVSTLYVLRGQLDPLRRPPSRRRGTRPARSAQAVSRVAGRRPLAGLRPAPRASSRGGRTRRSLVLRLDPRRGHVPRGASPTPSSGSVGCCLLADPLADGRA